MLIKNIQLNRIHNNLWEVLRSSGMLVPCRIYKSLEMIESTLQNDEAIKQVVSVAHLLGIQNNSLAMHNINWGYGFPIGVIAATNVDEGVISPSVVGYDINCGV
jgi:tRNA-splicing ligase RtcB